MCARCCREARSDAAAARSVTGDSVSTECTDPNPGHMGWLVCPTHNRDIMAKVAALHDSVTTTDERTRAELARHNQELTHALHAAERRAKEAEAENERLQKVVTAVREWNHDLRMGDCGGEECLHRINLFCALDELDTESAMNNQVTKLQEGD